MSTKAYCVLIVVVALLALLFELRNWMELTAATAVLAAIPWYFGTRKQGGEPSRLERALTAAWRWTRRLLCFAAGGFCLWGVVYILFFMEGPAYRPVQWFGLALLLLLGVALVIYGVVGGGGDKRR